MPLTQQGLDRLQKKFNITEEELNSSQNVAPVNTNQNHELDIDSIIRNLLELKAKPPTIGQRIMGAVQGAAQTISGVKPEKDTSIDDILNTLISSKLKNKTISERNAELEQEGDFDSLDEAQQIANKFDLDLGEVQRVGSKFRVKLKRKTGPLVNIGSDINSMMKSINRGNDQIQAPTIQNVTSFNPVTYDDSQIESYIQEALDSGIDPDDVNEVAGILRDERELIASGVITSDDDLKAFREFSGQDSDDLIDNILSVYEPVTEEEINNRAKNNPNGFGA